jgi:hypothetical protein
VSGDSIVSGGCAAYKGGCILVADAPLADTASLPCTPHPPSTPLPGAMSAQRGVPHQPLPDADPLILPLEDVLDVQRCDDPSLPPGGALWVSLRQRPLVSYGCVMGV